MIFKVLIVFFEDIFMCVILGGGHHVSLKQFISVILVLFLESYGVVHLFFSSSLMIFVPTCNKIQSSAGKTNL